MYNFLLKNFGFYNCLFKDGIEFWYKKIMCVIVSGLIY